MDDDASFRASAARDVLQGAVPVLGVGLEVGKRSVQTGIGVATGALRWTSAAMQQTRLPVVPDILLATSRLLGHVDAGVVCALELGQLCTQRALKAADEQLEELGVEPGALEAALLEASPGAHALAKIAKMVLDFGNDMRDASLEEVTTGLARLRDLQQAESNRDAETQQCEASATPSFHSVESAFLGVGSLAQHHDPLMPPWTADDKSDLMRFIALSCVAYGDLALRFLGVIKLNETSAVLHPGAAVVCKKTKGELYFPGYVLFVDHERKSIVVAIRGTFRPSDVVTDLMCMHEHVEHPFGSAGFVHGGMWKASANVSKALEGPIRQLWSRWVDRSSRSREPSS
jgi:hypothetical protein